MQDRFGVGRALGLTFAIWLKNLVPFTVLALILSAPELVYAVVKLPELSGEFDLGVLLRFSESYERNQLFLALLSMLLVTPPLTYGVVMELKGRRAGIGACIGVGLARLFPVLGVMLLLGIILIAVGIVAGILVLGLGLLGLVVGLVLVGVIYAVYYVAIPAAVLERPGVAGALSRSSALTRGRRGAVFGLLFLVFGVRIVITLVMRSVIIDENAAVANPDLIYGMLKTYYWGALIVGIIFSILAGTLASVTYYLLRSEKEGTSADELAAVFD